MVTKVFKSLGLEVPIQVPESVAEFDANAKREGACLEEAINNVVYRSILNQFRSIFLHGQEGDAENNIPEVDGLDSEQGVERENETNEKGELVKYLESEAKFFTRLCAQVNKEPSEFQDRANMVAKLIPFDASVTERKAVTPKKTAKSYLVAADSIIAKGQGDAVAAALAKILGTEVKADRESLGKAISLHEAKKRAEELKKLGDQYLSLVQQ